MGNVARHTMNDPSTSTVYGKLARMHRLLRDTEGMMRSIVDDAATSAEERDRLRSRTRSAFSQLAAMATGRYVRLHASADDRWWDLAGSGYDDDAAYALSSCIATANAAHAADGDAVDAALLDAALYCAVAFLTIRFDEMTFTDLIDLCAPQVFTPYTQTGEPDATGTTRGVYGYDIVRADRPDHPRLPSSRTLALIDKIPDDLAFCKSDEIGRNPYDLRYRLDHADETFDEPYAVFDSARYRDSHALLARGYREERDATWPTDVRHDPLPTAAAALAALPAAVEQAVDRYLCATAEVGFAGNDRYVPFVIDVTRLQRLLWRRRRAMDYGESADVDGLLRAVDSVCRRTWMKTRSTR
ncbi:hypothetical protein [Bifidobacterium parmae]|uniref:Uncharacterized protein n=1 Tax=Bifidobacterium parmae TaxID=361854 RepID=A0A2N5J657_9BIFI|nr:hypothetical protein [Bifidobacterium parmae]PLS29692.1 hypothetical protein Uis4E_0033 [Bifidobacterium parmae]